MLFQSRIALGDPEAAWRISIETTPVTSTSQALGRSPSLIMLMTVQGTTPKNSCSAVQHWIADPSSRSASIQSSTTAPSFAIFSNAASGTPAVVV